MPVLKLEKDDPKKELEFDVKSALMQPAEERLKMWYEWNLEMLNFAKERREALFGPQETHPITKRT